MPKKLDLNTLRTRIGTGYPPPFDEPCKRRERKALGDAAGLTQFGVNLLRLPAGEWSSQRHWHTAEDEFVYVLAGEVILVTNDGEETLRAGDCVGFKAGDANGHHLQNRSNAEVLLLEIGSRDPADGAFYSDIDLLIQPHSDTYCHLDGTPYES
ncbi:MAG: cupin domain-containing protein [Povalibacter sp.]